ncbi:protein MAIN-LIKE 1-like [Vigna angularis]|uniref:protein MAIN-LIKE 1-like n=1 Tax=Phaseolus angularis TaxID=3914 RepID=UPI0022B44A3F|nr:protein MAIN-LIKE 1-like [Vigna angularis]
MDIVRMITLKRRIFSSSMTVINKNMKVKVKMKMKTKLKMMDSQEVHMTPPYLLTIPIMLHLPYGKAGLVMNLNFNCLINVTFFLYNYVCIQDRRGIKVVTHGKKLKHFGMYHEAIEPYISMSGLGCLVNLSYEYADHGLIVALSERWHIETNTFHLPIGEMTVTLDDVMNLLHLPIMGQFCEVEELEYDEARSHIMELLGVDHDKASAEMKQSRGPKVRLSFCFMLTFSPMSTLLNLSCTN